MAKRLYKGNINGGVLATRTTYAQLKACAAELEANGFTVRENLHFGDKVLDRNAHSWNSLHYMHDGTAAIDINFTKGGRNNTRDELIMFAAFAVPIARKHGLKGGVHRPRRALHGTHGTWMHLDRSGWWDVNPIRLSAADKKRAEYLHSKYAQKSYTKPSSNKLQVDGVLGEKTIKAWQQWMNTPVDGVISPVSSLVKAVQKSLKRQYPWAKSLKVDGRLGRNTVKALQRHFGTPQDGRISKPSAMVAKLQRVLNTRRK